MYVIFLVFLAVGRRIVIRLNARVGLVDADVYGPSLPQLIAVGEQKVYYGDKAPSSGSPSSVLGYEDSGSDESSLPTAEQEKANEAARESIYKAISVGEGGLLPLMYGGVKLMSYGYVQITHTLQLLVLVGSSSARYVV